MVHVVGRTFNNNGRIPLLHILPEPDHTLAPSLTVSLRCLCHLLLSSSVPLVPPLPVEIRISAAMNHTHPLLISHYPTHIHKG